MLGGAFAVARAPRVLRPQRRWPAHVPKAEWVGEAVVGVAEWRCGGAEVDFRQRERGWAKSLANTAGFLIRLGVRGLASGIVWTWVGLVFADTSCSTFA